MTKEISLRLLRLLISLIIIVFVVIELSSCKSGGTDDPGPNGGPGGDEVVRVTGLLTSATWKLNSVTVDGVAKNLFPGMTLTFAATNSYTAMNGSPVWAGTGTWSLTDASAKTFIREDQVAVAIESITNTNLTLSLTWSKNTLGSGRVESIAGKNVFVFGK